MLVKLRGVDLPGTSFEDRHGVRVGLRLGRDVVDLAAADVDEACWQTEIRVRQVAEDYDYVGPAVRGRRGDRFLALAWIDETGEMFRALKLRLDQLPADFVCDAAAGGAGVVATVRLTDDRGGPLCATAPQSHLTWELEANC